MHDSARTPRAVSATVAIVLLIVACTDDSNRGAQLAATGSVRREAATTDAGGGPTVPESTVLRSDDEVVALTLCSALREQANVMTDIANTAAAGIHGKSPAERFAALDAGFGEGADASILFRDRLGDLDVPAIPELDDLLMQIAAGADAAAAEFVDQRERFAAAVGGEVTDDDVRGRVGELFNSIEKANSLVEPVIVRYERVELKRAFLDEPECRYVIQQFVLDE